MHAKYEVSISSSSKVLGKVKFDNRQTRQDKNNMPPIIQFEDMINNITRQFTFQLWFHICQLDHEAWWAEGDFWSKIAHHMYIYTSHYWSLPLYTAYMQISYLWKLKVKLTILLHTFVNSLN